MDLSIELSLLAFHSKRLGETKANTQAAQPNQRWSAVKIAFETVADFMADGGVGGQRACKDGAFTLQDVPHGACHGWRQKGLAIGHLVGACTKPGHVLANHPLDAHRVHDSVLRRHDIETACLVGSVGVRGGCACAQHQGQARDHQQAQKTVTVFGTCFVDIHN